MTSDGFGFPPLAQFDQTSVVALSDPQRRVVDSSDCFQVCRPAPAPAPVKQRTDTELDELASTHNKAIQGKLEGFIFACVDLTTPNTIILMCSKAPTVVYQNPESYYAQAELSILPQHKFPIVQETVGINRCHTFCNNLYFVSFSQL